MESLPQILEKLLARQDLTASETTNVFEQLLDGALTSAQIAGFLVAWRAKGESADEIAAAAKAMLSRAKRIDLGLSSVMDVVGTGGDGHGTVNLSSMAAVVVAACGVPVAKHGARAASSKAGAADTLETLGIPLDGQPEADFDARVVRSVHEAKIGFFFAPRHHSALRHAGPARRELAIRSIFNILGPLTNPAGATRHLLGVAISDKRATVATVLGALGSERAWVVTGDGGLDEVSPSGVTEVTEWNRGVLREFTFDPESIGFARVPLSSIKGGDPSFNAKVFRDLIDGVGGPVQMAVAINAAAALVVAERANDLKTGADMALDAIHSHAARNTFEKWKSIMGGVP